MHYLMEGYLIWEKPYYRDNARSRTQNLINQVFGEENHLDEFDLSISEKDMNEERSYRVYGYGNQENYTERMIECVINVSVGDDIFEAARNALYEAYDDKGLCSVTEIIEIPNCGGCQIEACGQRDHMLHPDGCLHDPINCEFCEMELKNISKLSQTNNKDDG
jgi:hypothetical protein